MTIFLPLVESTTQLKSWDLLSLNLSSAKYFICPIMTTIFTISMLGLGFKRIPLSPFQKNTVWWHNWNSSSDSLEVVVEEEQTMNDVIPL